MESRADRPIDRAQERSIGAKREVNSNEPNLAGVEEGKEGRKGRAAGGLELQNRRSCRCRGESPSRTAHSLSSS